MIGSLLAAVTLSQTAPSTPPPIIPLPSKYEWKTGVFVLRSNTRLTGDEATLPTRRLVGRGMEPALGFDLRLDGRAGSNTIDVRLDPSLARLGKDGYTLSVTADRVQIRASAASGAFYGLQSLKQLLPTDIHATQTVNREWTIPAIEIEDSPRFAWRGAMLDSCRHMQPKEFIKKFLDEMAAMKLNSFHWHLTEDQGWRIEIKKYPRLTEVGAWRRNVDELANENPHRYRYQTMFKGPEWYGGYYTQEEIKEIVAYAAERHINVVPEIEMPGHARAAIAAYPELGNRPDVQLEVGTQWGVISTVFSPRPATIQFLKDVLDEVMELFPSEFIHIGGDECPKDEWKASEEAQAIMRANNLKDEHELQSYFIRQIDDYITSKGRRMVGWSEILEGGLAQNATVMAWLGPNGAIEAARQGNDAVMSPTSHCYLDYYQTRDAAGEPRAIGGYLPLWRVYEYEPIPEALEPEFHKHILGVQGNLWTEYMPHPKQVEYMAFPRLSAIAETGWTSAERKNYESFLARLNTHLVGMDLRDIMYRRLDGSEIEPMAGWAPGEVGETIITREWDITERIGSSGPYSITFQYTEGGHRLEISSVEVLYGTQVVASSDRFGVTGGTSRDNTYKFDLPFLPRGTKVTLRARVRADGGSDSRGVLMIDRSTTRSGA
ncbi:MAG: beta-N-acetylhexosaminidase [Armatimonadota bacterium]|jgi:hexosaminidase